MSIRSLKNYKKNQKLEKIVFVVVDISHYKFIALFDLN